MIYPYWCLEKGYGAAVGRRDDTPEWAARARGWLRLMQLDAMLAALGVAVASFRWRATVPRLAPSRAWDALLAVSIVGLVGVGAWTVWEKLTAAW
jgi:hypothetical protein